MIAFYFYNPIAFRDRAGRLRAAGTRPRDESLRGSDRGRVRGPGYRTHPRQASFRRRRARADAQDALDLWDSTLLQPININELGTEQSGLAWTGSTANGARPATSAARRPPARSPISNGSPRTTTRSARRPACWAARRPPR